MQSIYDWKHSSCQSYDSKHYIWHLWRWLEKVRIQAEPSSCIIYGFTLLKYTINIYFYSALCQNDLDLFQQIRASILHIRLTCDYSTGSPSTKSHWVPSSHLTLETELTCNSLIWGRGAGGAGAFLKFKSKNALKHLLNAMSAKTCFAYSLSFKLCIYSSSGDYEHGWIWRSAYECHFWTNYKRT